MLSYPDSVSAMFFHGAAFAWKILFSYTDSIGDTVLGYFSPLLVAVLWFVFEYKGSWWRPSVVMATLREAIRKYGWSGLRAIICVYGIIFFVAAIKEVWKDHRFLVLQAATLADSNSKLETKLRDRTNILEKRDVAFDNMVGIFGAFLLFRQSIGADAPCQINLTAPQESQTMASTISVLVWIAASRCHVLGPWPLNTPEFEYEATHGMAKDAVVLHMPKGFKNEVAIYDAIGARLRLKRSYEMPLGSPENTIWLQFGTGKQWNNQQ
jgi:hypothetical protein